MSTSKFRVGMVGAGGIARGVHIPAWLSQADVEIVGVTDLMPAASEQAAKLAGERTVACATIEELLALKPDAIDVCTPNKAHPPVVIRALEAGCHVLCEKPLATSTAEIRAMGEAADKAGRVLCAVQNHRFRGETRAIRQWAETGQLGEVYHARERAMRRAFLPTPAGFIDGTLSGGGPCMDIGVHALDAAMWMMGFPKPVRVSGTSKVNFAKGNKIPGKWGEWDRARFSVEDFAAGFVHFDNGATLTLEAAWLGHQKEDEDFSFQLFGTEAGVQWPSGEFASTCNGTFVDGRVAFPNKVEKPHAALITAFLNACRNGGPSPVPWTEAIQVMAILEAIYTSQLERREITLSV